MTDMPQGGKAHPDGPMKKTSQGWHIEDIKAGLRKRGYTLARIGREMGHKDPRTPGYALRHRWPLVERRIADILEVHPAEIWPDRYKADGTPIGRGIRRQVTTSDDCGNGKKAGAA